MPTTSPLLILPDERVPQYLATRLGEVLATESAPAATLQTRLLSMPSVARTKLQQAILEALKTSNQSLTDHVLRRLDGGAVPPTVANWIADFGDADKLAWQAKSPAWQALDPAEQQRVGRLFELLVSLGHEVTAETTGTEPTPAASQPFIPSIQQIADTTGAPLTDPAVHNRFSTVVKSGIKGIRSSAQLAEILARAVNQGGLGFDQMVTQKVLAAIAPLADQYARGELVLTEQKLRAPQATGMSAPPMPSAGVESPIVPPSIQQPIQPLPVKPRPAAVQAPTPFMPVRRSNQLRRALVHDIKQPRSRLVSPVEELRRLDLQSFHRLGVDAISMVQKVKEKIDLMTVESLLKKAEGVKAWKQSPVNQLYLTIGAASMAMGKSVEAVIKDRLSANEPTLTATEFRAIADLNKALRF